MKRALKIALASVGALLVVAIGAVLFVLGTESGTRLVIQRALPESIAVGTIDGRLINHLVLTDLKIDVPGSKIAVGRAELQWSLSDIIGGRLPVQLIQADDVDITLLPQPETTPEPAAEPFRLPASINSPIDVGLEQLAINNLRLMTAPDAEPLVVDKISLSGIATDARFDIENLVVRSPLADVDAKARLTARDAWPVTANVTVALRQEGLAEVKSSVQLDGNLNTLRIKTDIAAPYNVQANAVIDEPLEDPGIDAQLTLDRINPAAIRSDLPEALFSAQIDANGNPSDLDLSAEFSAQQAGQRASGNLVAKLQPEQLRLVNLSIRLPGQGGSLDASGQVQLGPTPNGEGTVAWQNLQWPLGDTPDYRSERGNVQFSGTIDDYRLSSEAEVTLPDVVALKAGVSGTGNREGADLDLTLDALDGHMEGTANLSWQPAFKASVQLEGKDFNPASLQDEWPGRIDFAMRANAELAQDAPRIRLESLSVSGELRDQAVNVDAAAAYDAGALTVEKLNAALGSTRVSATGRYADTVDFTWQLDSDDLGTVLADASGKLTANGSVRGSIPQLMIDTELHAAELAYQDNRVASVDLNGDIDLTNESESKLTVKVDAFESGTFEADAVTLDVDGTLDRHRISIDASTSAGSADLDIDGQLQEPWSENRVWQFGIPDAELAYPELRPWTLAGRADGQVSADGVTVSEHCWSSDAARLCLSASRNEEQLQASFTLDELGFDYVAALLPPSWRLDGSLSGRGKVSQPAGDALRADVELTTSAGTLAMVSEASDADSELTETLLDLEPSRLALVVDDEKAEATAAIKLQQGRIDWRANIDASGAPFAERALTGSLQVDVPDVGFVEPFLPEVERVSGRIGGQLDFGGTPAQPTIAGQLALSDGAFESAAAGLKMSKMAFSVAGRRDAGIRFEGSANSGGGKLALNGDLAFGGDAATADVRVTGEDFQVLGTKAATLYVSPDLAISAGAETIDVTGTVRIPRASITPETAPESAVGASSDVVLMSDESTTTQEAVGRTLEAEIEILLGKDVRFEGFGLSARFEGGTTVIQKPDQPTAASGEITIAEGEYRAYGQGLVIESGKIVFAGGPITEPALDIRAVRRPEANILVGARVRGTVEEPSFTLFSEPSMTQQEQLSWLVLGRSLEQAPAGQSSALAQASLALGVKGGKFLADNLGENLGVDEFTIKSGSGEAGAASDPADAALVIGKYLSPKLYLSYGIGIFTPVSVLRMQYEINRRLKLLTESSADGSGADLVYSFERGE